MRLRLNTTLRAALIAAITAVGFTLTQAQASTEYNGVTYSGYIYNIATGQSATFHDRNFSNFYSIDGGTTWQTSTEFGGAGTSYYNGTEQKTTTDGKPFWRFTFGDGEGVRSTLRLTGATKNVYLESQFSPFNLGGLIAEAGDYTYAVGRQPNNKDCAITLIAEDGQKANMRIASNVHLSARNGFTVASSGKWDVVSGKTLAVGRYDNGNNVDSVQNNASITFNGGLHVDMIGGGTIDLTHTNALTVGVGTTISVGDGTKLLLASNTTLGGTITNAGTVTFASDTVTLGTDLSGFDDFAATYEDYTGVQAENGFVGAVACTVINNTGAGQSNLSKVVYGGNTYNLDNNGKVVIADGINYTTYYLNTDGATVDLAQAITRSSSTLTTVEVKGETGTITVNSNSTLGSLSIASGSTATVNGTAELTLNGLAGAGALNIAAGTTTLGSAITNAFSGTVSVANATLNIGSNRQNISTLTIDGGGVVNASGADNSNGCVSGDINIKAGGTFKMTGHHDGFGWGNNATKNIILTGESNSKLATLELNQTTTNSATMKTNIAMHGYSKITSSNDSKGFNTYGGSIFAENTNNTIDKIQLRSDATIQVAAAGELSVGNMIYGTDGGHNLTKTGEGTLTFTGVANMNSLTLNGGSVVFNGTSSIANGLTQAEGKSITVGGSLTLGGTVTFGGKAIGVTDGGSFTKGTNLVFNLDGLTASESSGTYTYTLFDGAIDLQSLTTSNITLTEGTSGKVWSFNNDGTISFTTSASKVWTGDPGADWNHTDLTWEDGTPFEDGDSVQFGDEAYVNVGEDVAASVISVEGDSVLYLSATEGAHLSADSLAVGAGSGVCTTVAIDGLQTYSLGEGSSWVIGADQTLETAAHGGLVIVDEGAVVTVNGTSTASDLSGFANDGGTLSVALANATEGDANIVTMLEVDEETPSSGTFELRSGTIDYRSDLGDQTLKLDAGTRLLFGRAEGDTTHTYAGDIEVAGNATIRTHGASQHPDGTTISGNVTGNGTLTRENDGNRTMYFTGTVNIGGYTNADTAAPTDFQGATTLGTLTADAGSTTKFSGSKADLGTMTVKGNAAVEINTTATISSMLDLSDGGKSSGTVTVKANKSLSIAEGATYWGGKNSSILMEEGGILNLAGMQIVGGAEIGAVVETTADNTQYGIGSASWSINGADITATKNINVGNELYFSTIDTGAFTVQLTNTENTLSGATVGTGGSLSMSGGTLFSVIESGGSVTLTGTTLDEESFIEQGGETGSHYDLNGQLTDGDNYYLGTSEKYLTVVNGGTSATGSGLTWGEKQNLTMTDGKVVTEAGEIVYETFYVNADSVNVSAITNTGTTGVQVAGGTLVVDKVTSLNITVTDEGTITGDKADAKQVNIASGATAYYTGGVEDSGVKFTPSELLDGAVEVDNYGQTQKYSIASRDLSVAAGKLEMTDKENNVTVSNQVVVNELVNTTGRTLTLDNVEDTLELVNMDITASTVKVYTNLAPETEATVSISGVLQGGDATLLANLTLKGGSTLNVNGGDTNALTLGSMLTFDFSEQQLVNLDEDTIAALNKLTDGQKLDLIVAAEGTQLDYSGAQTGMSYDQLFSADGLTGTYTVYADGSAFGLTKSTSPIPEPTTGTLSLLALAALAARRRRK